MPDGAGGFPQGFTGPAVLRNRTSLRDLPVRDCHPLRWSFPARLRSIARWIMSVLQPPRRLDAAGLGSSPFARHYLGNSYWSLLLGVLRCFSSPGSPPFRDNRPLAGWVAPFGHPRITGRLRLPADFRSLPRPSSPLDAQASTHAPLFTFSSVRRSLTLSLPRSLYRYVKQLFWTAWWRVRGPKGGRPALRAGCPGILYVQSCGEYRIRTDDPLLAKQVL